MNDILIVVFLCSITLLAYILGRVEGYITGIKNARKHNERRNK